VPIRRESSTRHPPPADTPPVDQETADFGFEAFKYVLLFASVPLWGPFAKALWDEFLLALRADGGLAGHEPNRRERAALEEKIQATGELSQVHEPIAHVRPGRARSSSTRAASAPLGGSAQQRSAGPQLGNQRRPFSSPTGRAPSTDNRPHFR
jgi:hypothetical protein